MIEQPSIVAALAPPQPILPAQAEVDAFAAAAGAEVKSEQPATVDLANIRAPVPEFLAERSTVASAQDEPQAVEVASLPTPDLIRSRMLTEPPVPSESSVNAASAAAETETAAASTLTAAAVQAMADLPSDDDFVPLPIRRPGESAAEAPAAVMPQTTELASLAPTLRGGRLPGTSASVSSSKKGVRPNATQVAEQPQRVAIRTEPKLNDTMISQWALAQERVQSMSTVPGKGRHFVVSQLRAAPKVVYADGFAPGGGDLPHNQFTGSAVNFVTVARFDK